MGNYWVIAPYESKYQKIFDRAWQYDLKNGTIAIGWNWLGDISKLNEKEFKKRYMQNCEKDSRTNRTIWRFHHEISVGDIVIARRGRTKLIGIGDVVGTAFYDVNKGKERVGSSDDAYYLPNFIKVKWKEKVIDYGKLVFPQRTLWKIPKGKYNSLIKGEIPEQLEEQTQVEEQQELEDYPDLKNTKSEFINLKINNAQGPFGKERKRTLSKTKTVDFEKENKENRILGELGEIIVLRAEKNDLKQKGKHNLADEVKQISKENVSAGYDIISFEPDGHKKYIEVKSTNNSPSNKVNFFITSNEYDNGKELKNYYIYIVFNAKSKNPKIGRLKAPFSFEGKGLSLTPVSFRVEISTIGTNELT